MAVSLIIGCSSTIFKTKTLSQKDSQLVSIDAKQRVVLSSPGNVRKSTDQSDNKNTPVQGSEKNETEGYTSVALRFCVEPSPDVFTVLASSIGAEASAMKSPSIDANIAAKFAATFSENAATIERTQTINILREVMYRNCERYLSGAISETEFIVQAARDQQLIVQVLAVEQITGVARAQSTALLNLSNAAAGGVTDAGLKTLADAKNDLDAKRAASEKAISEASNLPPEGACQLKPIDIENPPDGVTAEQATTKNMKCAEAKKATTLLKESEEYFGVIKGALAQQSAVSGETKGILASAAQTTSEASENIAKVVLDIVKQYQTFDEIGMTCVVHMRSGRDLPDYCKDLLDQMAVTRQVQLKSIAGGLDPQLISKLKDEYQKETKRRAKLVWDNLKLNFKESELQSLASKAGIQLNNTQINRLVNSNKSFDEFNNAFKRLSFGDQQKLAKAASKN
jgi:hypothetical protein